MTTHQLLLLAAVLGAWLVALAAFTGARASIRRPWARWSVAGLAFLAMCLCGAVLWAWAMHGIPA